MLTSRLSKGAAIRVFPRPKDELLFDTSSLLSLIYAILIDDHSQKEEININIYQVKKLWR